MKETIWGRLWTMMKEAVEAIRPGAFQWACAAVGAAMAWWAGLPAIAKALLLLQGADVLTGLLCALTGKSPKSGSGKISSSALTMGVVKKGLEWLVVGICVSVGEALEMSGIGGAAMTYMIGTELVSFMENVQTFGLNIPLLSTLLDVAQGKREE